MHFQIEPKSAVSVEIAQGKLIKIIDVEGKQVADLVAFRKDDPKEYLSTACTIDANQSLNVTKDSILYSNSYNPVMEIVEDTVRKHDLIHPMCRPAMYAFQYGIVSPHRSCYQNIKEALITRNISTLNMPAPFNIFMNTVIHPDGTISIKEPQSSPGDHIVLKALTDMIVVVAACSVEESNCNGFKCSSLALEISD